MDLRRDYDSRGSAITIAKFGSEYRMMLRSEYADFTGEFSKADMSGGTMRTLSTIAYNQPVLQSALFKVLGSRTYDDVRELMERDFVSGRKKGQTLELTTTKRFQGVFRDNRLRQRCHQDMDRRTGEKLSEIGSPSGGRGVIPALPRANLQHDRTIG
jgi:segregation and condensation protein B